MRAVGEVGRVAGKAFVCFLAVSTLALVGVAMIRSTGAAGVPGVGFITLAATLSIVPSIPVAGMALILGVDRFMSECRALDTERLAAAMVSKPMPLLPENIERHERSGPRSEALAEAMAEAS